MSKLSNFSLGVLIGLFLAAVFGAGLLAGAAVERSRSPYASAASDKNLQDFLSAYRLVTTDSYYRPFNKAQLVHAAIDGMLAATGDAHTLYFSSGETKAENQQLNGSDFAGIGAIVLPTARGLQIVTPLPHSPARTAGLRAGDVITAINGHSVLSMSGNQAVTLIHGRSGTVVHLRIRHASKNRTVTVRRAVIAAVTAYGKMLSHHLGYVQIMSYGLDTAQQVRQALKSLDRQGMKGLVLDLRGNPGGYVDSAREIVSDFLSSGVVAYEQQANHHLTPLTVLPGRRVTTVPVAILVDSNTASAAEITAAALRDEDHAYLIGTRTYGKGSMQSVFSLPDGSTLRITDRLWLTPDKTSIQNKGLQPNEVLHPSARALQAGADPDIAAAERYLLHHQR